ncbi:hypothetical protein C0J52_06152 [Blattella germanica]|nr:hypothetical protein C0J52_06152 [Blattella germanica]
MSGFILCFRQFPLAFNVINKTRSLSSHMAGISRAFHIYFRDLKHTKYQCGPIIRTCTSTATLDVNTKVGKDVILYHYENPKFFRIVNIFALSQFGFWTYLSHFAFTSLKDAPAPKQMDSVPWWRRINLGENKYRNGLTALSFLVGYGILTAAWLFTLKSVRYLILRKGGDKLTFITYTPFGKNRMTTVDLNKVSSQETRQNAKVQLPIKVKDHRLYYVLDMKGDFKNPKLFDSTAGLKRTWKE